MIENGIFVLSLVSVLIATICASILILAKTNNYDGLYTYFDDKQWLDIPKLLAQKYIIVFKKLFGQNLFGLRAALNIILLSFFLTIGILILWRGLAIGSFYLAIEQAATSNFGVTLLSWGLSSALVAPLSLVITAKLLFNSANSTNHRTVYRNVVIDIIATYLLISLSIYLCLISTLPAIMFSEKGWDGAVDIISIMLGFAHRNALIWPNHAVLSIEGLSIKVTAIATLLPTITFIILMGLSFLGIAIFKFISPIIVKHLNWLSNQDAAKLSLNTAILCAILSLLSALIKHLEIIST